MSDVVEAEDAVPWPGFVDILSSVIIMFIFFVMLTVIIISQLTKKTQVADGNKAKQEVNYTTNTTEKSFIQKTILDNENNKLYVLYGDIGITVLEETQNYIKTFFKGSKKVQIHSYAPQYLNYTTKKEIALYRAFKIRNQLLENGIDSSNISLKIHESLQENKKINTECIKSTLGCVVIKQD